MTSDLSRRFLGILMGEALSGRPGEGFLEAKEHEKEDLFWLSEDEERVSAILNAGHGPVSHSWSGGAHSDVAGPISFHSCTYLLSSTAFVFW